MTLLKSFQSKRYFRKYKLFLILYLLLITIATLAILTNDYVTRNRQISKIREAMLSDVSFGTGLSLRSEESTALESYVFMTNVADFESIPHDSFSTCWSSEENFGDLCEFGIKLIVLYKRSPEHPSRYLQIVEDIIRRILAKFKTIDLSNTIYPWGKNWYAFSVRMTKLLIMYVYLGPDHNIKYDSYKLIVRMITDLNTSHGRIRKGVNIVYLSIPRLCGAYYYDKKLFDLETDKNYEKFQTLTSIFNIKYNKGPALEHGAYADGSYIDHLNVATFSYFVTIYGFYEEVYKSLGFPTNIKQVADYILNKLFHPNMGWLQLGLFGRDGSRYNVRKWWNVTGKKGGFDTIALMPFIGLGVFKADDFMFSVRVQRQGIAAYETFPKFEGKFALGWVQLRRIYIKNIDYERTLTWESLKNEPGLLIPEDGRYQKLVAPGLGTTKSYFCNVAESFIGRLMEHDLMFWKNTYNFPDVYGGTKTMVTEAAVVTTYGLEAYIKVENHCGKNLKFIWKDTVNALAINDVNGSNRDRDFIIKSGETKYFTWRMLVRDGIDSQVMLDKDTLKFKYNEEDYTVKTLKDTEKFVVTRNRDPILLGTSSSDPNDSASYGEGREKKYYTRDPNTMMYNLKPLKINTIDK